MWLNFGSMFNLQKGNHGNRCQLWPEPDLLKWYPWEGKVWGKILHSETLFLQSKDKVFMHELNLINKQLYKQLLY